MGDPRIKPTDTTSNTTNRIPAPAAIFRSELSSTWIPLPLAPPHWRANQYAFGIVIVPGWRAFRLVAIPRRVAVISPHRRCHVGMGWGRAPVASGHGRV